MRKFQALSSALIFTATLATTVKLAPPAAAAPSQWVEIAQSEQGDKIFIDANNILTYKRVRPYRTQYRTMILYSKPFAGASKFTAHYNAYCEARAQSVDSFIAYDSSNQIIKSVQYGAATARGDFRNIGGLIEVVRAGTLESAAFEYACSRP